MFICHPQSRALVTLKAAHPFKLCFLVHRGSTGGRRVASLQLCIPQTLITLLTAAGHCAYTNQGKTQGFPLFSLQYGFPAFCIPFSSPQGCAGVFLPIQFHQLSGERKGVKNASQRCVQYPQVFCKHQHCTSLEIFLKYDCNTGLSLLPPPANAPWSYSHLKSEWKNKMNHSGKKDTNPIHRNLWSTLLLTRFCEKCLRHHVN